MEDSMAKIKVLDQDITVVKDDYISLTDIANSKESESRAADIIKNWIRNRGTLEFIGTWEQIHNDNFISYMFHYTQIMRYKQTCKLKFFAQIN